MGMIFINFPGDLILRDDHPYSNGWWLRDDVYDWLKANVGKGNQAGSWVKDQDWMWAYSFDGQPINNVIGFNNPDAAIIFKLTWA